jgi:hypothetical protein
MADWLTFDEKRSAMNYEERGGAYEYSYVNQGLIPLEQVMMDLSVSNDQSMSNDQSGDMGNGDSQVS